MNKDSKAFIANPLAEAAPSSLEPIHGWSTKSILNMQEKK